jgi:hypothetical protein
LPIAHERFLRAELAAALGRTDEALRWYATFPDPRTCDLTFYSAALERVPTARRRLVSTRSGRGWCGWAETGSNRAARESGTRLMFEV